MKESLGPSLLNEKMKNSLSQKQEALLSKSIDKLASFIASDEAMPIFMAMQIQQQLQQLMQFQQDLLQRRVEMQRSISENSLLTIT